MLDMLAAAALNGTMVVAVASKPRLYTVDVGMMSPSSPALPPDKRPKLDCSKLLLTYGGITVDTSLPSQKLQSFHPHENLSSVNAQNETAAEQGVDAVVASQLASGTHAAVSAAASGPADCNVTFIAAEPLPEIKASGGSLALKAHVTSSVPVNVTPERPVIGYRTQVEVYAAQSVAGGASAGGRTASAPAALDCKAVVLGIGGTTIDTSKPFVRAHRGMTGLLIPAAPYDSQFRSCVLLVTTPGPVGATSATIAGVPGRVNAETSTPLYGATGTPPQEIPHGYDTRNTVDP